MKRTIREACRRRMPLDGTDAECLEYALAQAERDRDTAIARAEAAEDREERLREALREQERLWRSLPSGVDEEADPDDRSPEDAFAWTAGIAVRAIRTALSDGAGATDALGRRMPEMREAQHRPATPIVTGSVKR